MEEKKEENLKDASVPPAPEENPETPDKPEAQENQEASEQPQAPEKAQAPAEPEKPAEPDWKSLYALTLADFDNYKKRAARERSAMFVDAEAQIIKDILPSVDNLALALDKAENADDPFVKGVKLVYDTLLSALKGHGAEQFDSLGLELDTDKMEAVAQLPSDEYDEGKVCAEVKKGWTIHSKTLRAAQVVVSSGKKSDG